MARKRANPTNPTAPKRGRRPDSAPDWVPLFLAALREHGTVYHACLAAGVDRSTVYDRRQHDEEFAALFDGARQDADDVLEREAVRRGAEGYHEPVIYQGRLMGEWQAADGRPCEPDDDGARFVPLCVRRYSDRLLSNLLRWRRYPAPKPQDDDEDAPFYPPKPGPSA